MSDLYFSVVVPTYNRIDVLLRVLDSLSEQDDAPPFEEYQAPPSLPA